MRRKHWARSLTIQFNAAVGVAGAILPLVAENIGLLDGALPPAYYKWLVFVLTVGNLALRCRTKQAIGAGQG
jgi:hypothetical protein